MVIFVTIVVVSVISVVICILMLPFVKLPYHKRIEPQQSTTRLWGWIYEEAR